MFDKGIAIRRDIFGAELADKAWAAADDFNRPFEELVNQYCFGEIWGRPGLDRKTRSIVTLSMLTGLNRRIERSANCYALEDPDSLAAAVAATSAAAAPGAVHA